MKKGYSDSPAATGDNSVAPLRLLSAYLRAASTNAPKIADAEV